MGGIVGGISGVYLDDPCGNATFADYANAAVLGGIAGGVTGTVGGDSNTLLNSTGVTGALAETISSMITAPIGMDLGVGASVITQ